ncbi:MAG: threonine/serine exporter family protein [Oscillospiraceae bacterium]|nr:threonine/serine exporter family protein [Oscillospiraceae bacterium]
MDFTRQEQKQFLDCLLEMGDLLLDSGAEISRVEDTLERMGRSYGSVRTDVFVIPSLISITMDFPGNEAITATRRIHSNGNTDFYRLEKLNSLSRECSVSPVPLSELRERLTKVAHGRKPFFMVLVGSILGGGGFAVFFGGSLWDGLAAAFFGAMICLMQRWIGRTQLNTTAANLMVSLLVGLAAGLVGSLIPALHMDKILIGDIMLLIPGLTMTNAIRNTLVGNTISGVVRLCETLIWAGSLAGGFMLAMLITESLL